MIPKNQNKNNGTIQLKKQKKTEKVITTLSMVEAHNDEHLYTLDFEILRAKNVKEILKKVRLSHFKL